MTNASSDDNPFDSWRAEIRAFCGDIRQELEAISAEIDAVQPEKTTAAIAPTALPNDDMPTASTSAAKLPTPQPEVDTVVAASHATPTDAAPTPDGDRTEDRLQSVRLQLQAMLNSVNG